MQLIRRYSNCFVCGDKNETGLKVDFYHDGGVAKGEYVPDERFQGYKDILHGGIISSLLDEVMIKAVIAKNLLVVTAKIEVRFLKPVRIGEKLLLEGRILEEKGRVFMAEGKAYNSNKELVAVGKGKFYKVTEEMKKILEESLE